MLFPGSDRKLAEESERKGVAVFIFCLWFGAPVDLAFVEIEMLD